MSSASTSSSRSSVGLEDYEAVFAAIDSAARRQILMILHFRGDQMTSGEIADRFSCAWATTSRHLRKLESSGLVVVERSGREWIYRLDRGRLGVIGEWLGWFSRPAAGAPDRAAGAAVGHRVPKRAAGGGSKRAVKASPRPRLRTRG